MNLGEIIYSTIDKDQFYINVYDNILFNFALKQLNINLPYKEIDINKALRYADILSRSNHNEKGDEHRIIAQEMVSILNDLYPYNEQIKYYLGTILTNNGNYLGKTKLVPNYKSIDPMEILNDIINEKLLAIPGEENKLFFFQQKEVFNNLNCKYYSYSGPTSMGKTFIIRMFIKDKVMNDVKANFAIIVPSKALISEISRAIINDLKHLLIEKSYKVVTTGNSTLLEKNGNFIFVLTPERLLYLLTEKKHIKIEHMFIDEAHKISLLESRSTFYYKVVTLAESNNNETKFAFASPNISNPSEFLKLIPSMNDILPNNTQSKYSPVSQIKYIIDFQNNKFKYYNFKEKTLIDINENISEECMIDFIFNNKRNEQTLVYCDRKEKALDYANQYYNKIKSLTDYVISDKLLNISNQIKDEIHSSYLLAEYIKYGIAFHVGFVPLNVRTSIEELYKAGELKIVFCTSTLIEGVNFPAENLFVTSTNNGKNPLTLIDFKNLTGRVGRIEYNTYGKVYLVRDKDVKDTESITYEDLLFDNDNSTKLSIITDLKYEEKEQIITTLLSGNTYLQNNDVTKANYKVLRKLLSILLKDIMSDNKTLIVSSFNEFLNENTINSIKSKFISDKDNIDDDINHTLDQVKNIDDAISKEELCYPILSPGVKYKPLYDFLCKLADKFKWNKYESDDIGAQNRNGEYKLLSWYTSILMRWMNGSSIKEIIENSIERAIKKDPSITNNPKKLNKEISTVLEIIENIILFKFANYFLRFSTEYKKLHNLAILPHDWYEFVEYGSYKQQVILLQKLGFSRETALIINNIRAYKFMNGKIYISKELLNSKNINIKKEANELYYNLADIFIDF